MRIVPCLAAAAALAAPAVRAEQVRLTGLRVHPVPSNANLVANPGFEAAADGGFPVGWRWSQRNTDARCEAVREAHQGAAALRIANGTDEAPHTYGLLEAADVVRLTPGRTYTLSVWARSAQPGHAWIGGGRDWRVRLWIAPTGGGWRRFSRRFTAEESEREFHLLAGTDSPTDGIWIDDIKIEEGAEATPANLPAPRPGHPAIVPPVTVAEAQGDGVFEAGLNLVTREPIRGRIHASLDGAAAAVSAPIECGPGAWRIEVAGTAAAADYRMRTLRVRLECAGRAPIAGAAAVRLLSRDGTLASLAAVRRRLPALEQGIERLQTRGADVSYPLVTMSVLRAFVPYAEEDARGGLVWRAAMQGPHLERMAARLAADLRAALAGRMAFPAAPRWTGAARPEVRGSSFLAPTRTPGTPGIRVRPVFLNGFGHFGQARADIERFPALGVNAIQMEFGPSAVFPSEGVVDMGPVRAALSVLDRAARNGVAVVILISPHYMPDWVLAKYPHLRKRRDGFLQYCLHAPESRELLQRFIATAITPLADHPALQSICLSNEPVNVEEPCEPAARDWRAWLARTHGGPAALNARWGSSFASIDEVPLPNPFGSPVDRRVLADYYRWNQEFFAGWHRMLADAVHRAAPGVPVHAKAMQWTMTNQGDLRYGVDAALFGSFSQISGNDAATTCTFGEGEFAQAWVAAAMGIALQRSVLDAPVFNTENHIIPDRERRDVPADHVRAALWQSAVEGQSGQTMWVWERTFDLASDFAGSILHHPACAEAAGIVNHDLNRAALEVTALQQAPPQALILHSASGMLWEGSVYGQRQQALFQALAFLGVRAGFVTERQLEAGAPLPRATLFVPGRLYLTDAAARALARFEGRVVYVGDGPPAAFDAYGSPALRRTAGDRLAYRAASTTPRDVLLALRQSARRWGLSPEAACVDARSGAPVWGVATRSARTSAGVVLNACNYGQGPVRVRVASRAASRRWRDVLTGAAVTGPFTLRPLEVRLLASP